MNLVIEKKKDVVRKKQPPPAEVTPEEAAGEMARFFAELEVHYKDVPEDELRQGAQRIQDFISGRIGWAELLNVTTQMLFQMAEFGYTQFKVGRYQDAERIFKILTVLEWNNSYYHSMMGSILQRQKRYGESIAEYSQAIALFPEDIVSLTHRGEIYLQHHLEEEAKTDLSRAVALDPKGENRWANRARILLAQIEKRRKPVKKETPHG